MIDMENKRTPEAQPAEAQPEPATDAAAQTEAVSATVVDKSADGIQHTAPVAVEEERKRSGEQPIVRIRNLQKSFDDLVVLRGVDLDVYRGEVVVILGPSGSGKSTMLRCINRLRIGKVARRLGIAERTQQERRVHLRGAGAFRLEGRFRRAGGQTILIQVLHIGLLPALQIGKRRAVLQLLRLLLRAQQAHQHDGRLCAARRAVQLIALLRAAEQAELAQMVCACGEIRSQRGYRKRAGEHCGRAGHANIFFHVADPPIIQCSFIIAWNREFSNRKRAY